MRSTMKEFCTHILRGTRTCCSSSRGADYCAADYSGTHDRASFCGGVLYVAQGGHTSLHGCAFDQNTELDCVRQAHSTSSIASATPASVSLVHDEFSGENYDVVRHFPACHLPV